MAFKFYAKSQRGSQYSNDMSNALQSGERLAVANTKARIDQQNNYMQALQTQREYEMHKENQDFELSKKALHDISEKFPMGDEKSEQQYELYKQTDQYKELIKHVKKGMPWAVVDGDIQRMPKYKVLQDQLKFEKDMVEKRVQDGTASEADKLQYARSKALIDIHKQAEKLVTTKNGGRDFDNANPAQQSDMISQEADVLMQSLLSTLSTKGQLPNPEPAPAPKQNPLTAILGMLQGDGQQQPVKQGEQPVQSNNKVDLSSLWNKPRS